MRKGEIEGLVLKAKLLQKFEGLEKEYKSAREDGDLIWVLTSKEVELNTTSQINETKNRIQTGISISRKITSIRLSKPENKLSHEEIKKSGPKIYISGYDSHNKLYRQRVKEKYFAKEFNFPDENLIIGPIENNLHTAHQFERFPKELLENNITVLIITDAYHIPRSKYYLKKYQKKFSKNKVIFIPSSPSVLNKEKIFSEVEKIVQYGKKNYIDLSERDLKFQIAITGSTGFIGSALLEKMRGVKNIVVRIYDKRIHDLNKADSLIPLVKGCDVVFHLAGVTQSNNPEIFNINEGGTLNLLKAITKSNSSPLIVFVSSFAVYKPVKRGEVITEESTTTPRNNYGLSKLKAEKLIEKYNKNKHLNATILRISDTYGPLARPFGHSVIATFKKLLADRKPLIITGDGKQTRDYVYIDDVVDALILASVQKTKELQIFNICSNRETSIIGLVRLIKKITRRKFEIIFQETISSNLGFWRGSNSLAKKILGWSPKISIQEGLERVFSKNSMEKNSGLN